MTIYKKPTQTGSTIPASSNHPPSHKMVAYNAFIYRILRIPLSNEARNKIFQNDGSWNTLLSTLWSKNICFSLPEKCPMCEGDLEGTNFSLLPFSDYFNSKDLHVGVTTSRGDIVEFDKNGLRSHQSIEWGQCLLLDQAPRSWSNHWNTILKNVCDQKCWCPESYREDSHNCYSFVLTFLKNLGYGSLSSAANSKTTFCEKFIIPRTISAGKYISLYRKLKKTGIYVHKSKK
ncbi:MKRN2 opposite strand protein-like isoform X2 [Leptinotarsa decemlineata]|uniref:MKRN2 opposite strand protein-like isoform X2 n=1 Tax=Leptinotarsa decemlineata TaxID=7539 RepID=UPI003D306C19